MSLAPGFGYALEVYFPLSPDVQPPIPGRHSGLFGAIIKGIYMIPKDVKLIETSKLKCLVCGKCWKFKYLPNGEIPKSALVCPKCFSWELETGKKINRNKHARLDWLKMQGVIK